jgi:hypothetical protein
MMIKCEMHGRIYEKRLEKRRKEEKVKKQWTQEL